MIRACPFCNEKYFTEWYLNTICRCGAKYYQNEGRWLNRGTGEWKDCIEENPNCDVCCAENNDFVLLNKTKEYSGIEIAANKQGMLRVRYYGDSDNFESQDIIHVACCPRCGRKMKG